MDSRKQQLNAWRWVPTLYFAEGLPYVAVMTLAVIMYKRLGVGNADIALYTAWLYLPWVIKPLWSPFVDMFSTKRRWIVAMQWAVGACFAGVALLLPLPSFFAATLAVFWLLAFVSATHDIAADGFYMMGLSQRDQSLFVGIRTLFYRLAMITGQGALVVMAGWLEAGAGITRAWQITLGVVSAAFVVMALYHSFVLPRPAVDRHSASPHTVAGVFADFKASVTTFFTKPHAVTALLFMLLYRFPEAQLVKLISPFLLDSPESGGLGLTTAQVGVAYGTVGVGALLAGGVAGGWAVSRGGLRRWMMPMAWSMSLTCLTFVYLSCGVTPSLFTVNICVLIEQFGYGFGSTAYTLYLIHFSDGQWRTSHYAIATGLMALGMMVPGMWAGWLQEAVGYFNFFIWTMLCCAVTIIVALSVKLPSTTKN